MRVETVTLFATVADHRKGPNDPLPQVAFAGRSNVGKSSLLNSLFGKQLAAVSKSPGKTRTLNYYLVNSRWYFVDLPGYGYARTAREQRQEWGRNITTYLLEEDRLRLVVGLVDPRIPTSPLDVDLVGFVRQAEKPLLLVMTKTDRMGRGALAQAGSRLSRELAEGAQPIAFSAHTGAGRKEILATIAQTLAA
jgi:GTP-binding protein